MATAYPSFPIQLNSTISPRGAYSESATYGIGDSVSFNGNSYLAIMASIGNLPTNESYWQLLASKGETGSSPMSRKVILSALNISNKRITLENTPISPLSVSLFPDGGIPQRNEIDFEVIGNEVSWNGMGLDGVLEAGEIIFLTY